MSVGMTLSLRSDITSVVPKSAPRLSILLLARSGQPSGGSLEALLREVSPLGAQVVVAGEPSMLEGSLPLGHEDPRVRVVPTEPGACRDRTVELGMAAVDGHIVLVREACQLGEHGWLKPVAHLVGVGVNAEGSDQGEQAIG